MKKRYMIPAIGAVASAGIGYLLMKNSKEKEESTFVQTFANAGMPDQVDSFETDQLENAKMVSEGSQFGVQYFNHAIEDGREYLEDQIQN